MGTEDAAEVIDVGGASTKAVVVLDCTEAAEAVDGVTQAGNERCLVEAV